MFNLFRKKEVPQPVLKSNFKKGDFVYGPGDYPRFPKIVYSIITSGHVMAAEFMVTRNAQRGLNVQFVRNVCEEPDRLSIKENEKEVEDFLIASQKHHLATHEFIEDLQLHEYVNAV